MVAVLSFARFISTPTTALVAVMVAGKGSPLQVGVAAYQGILGGDSWRTAEEVWIQNLRVTSSVFDELCDATGPLVAPTEPVPTKCIM